jgi:hypothetical protein
MTIIAPSDLPPDVIATKGETDNELAIRIFVREPHLHLLRDDDRGIELAHWEVEAILSDDHDIVNTVLLQSRSAFQEGDTHASIANEFGADIARSLEAFFMSVIKQEQENANDN